MATRAMRRMIEKYQRGCMLALVIFLLVIFTVTGEFTDFLAGAGGREGPSPEDEAGSFAVLRGERTSVSWAQYHQAKSRYGTVRALMTGSARDEPREIDVWTHLVLLEAARREGVAVSDEEVVEVVQAYFPPDVLRDRKAYRTYVLHRYRAPGIPEFEEAIRELLMSARLRQIYQDSFFVAPPATREEMVENYTNQLLEHVKISWAALDAGSYLEQARQALKAESNPDEKLKEFFETDAAVKRDQGKFRHPRRYRFESIYTLHKVVADQESYERLEELFAKAYPSYPLDELATTRNERLDYYRQYRDHLLETIGTSLTELIEEEKKKEEKEKEPEDPGESEDPDEAKDPGEEEPGEEDPEKEPELEDPSLIEARRQAAINAGFEILEADGRLEREIRLRKVYQHLLAQAQKDAGRSLKAIFDELREHDDPENPVLSTEMGEGIVVYLEQDEPLTADQIQSLEDRDVRFTHNFLLRVTRVGTRDLPKVVNEAAPFGPIGHGRTIIRVLEVQKERAKSFDELTEADREVLIEEFYLPDAARERARETLEQLRKQCVDEDLGKEEFLNRARALDARVYEEQWLTASSSSRLSPPDEESYWPHIHEMLSDRYFLHRDLGVVLAGDRVKKKLGPGSYLEVRVDDARRPGDPGTAYLVLLHEREPPAAETMPPREFDRFVRTTQETRAKAERKYWTSAEWSEIKRRFDFRFSEEMQKQIQREEERLQRQASR